MARNPQIVVEYVAKTAALKAGIDDASKQTGGFANKLKGLAKGGALAAGAAGIGGLVTTLKIGFDEFKQGQQVAAQTSAVIKSTGGAAKVTAGHVDDLAGALMKKSGVDDEAIASGENVLLTFTNIRNEAGKGKDIFDQTTKAALDMSVALGTDMKTASMQLGKALNDPIKGMSKLTKQGVTFTDAQKKQAEAMVKAGDTAGAQKLILAELNKEFGGSAEAAGKTLPGQISILRETFNNLAGALVAKLIPVLQDAIAWLRDHWPEISAAFNSFWQSVKPILENLWSLLGEVASLIKQAWPAIEPVLQSLAAQVQAMATIIAGAIKLIVDIIHGDWSAAWEDVKRIVSAALDFVKARIEMFTGPIKVVASALGKAIFGGIREGVGAIGDWIGERVSDVRNAITGAATSIYNAAKSLGGKVLSGIAEGATGIYTAIREKVQSAIDAVSGFFDSAYSKALSLGSRIKNGIVDGITGLAGGIRDIVRGAINSVIDVINGFHIPAIKIKGHTIFGGGSPFHIAHLAQGGIVTSPTLALIGEAGPEAVIPLSDASAAPAVQVRVFIGDTELKGLVRTEIVDHETGIARTLLAGAAG